VKYVGKKGESVKVKGFYKLLPNCLPAEKCKRANLFVCLCECRTEAVWHRERTCHPTLSYGSYSATNGYLMTRFIPNDSPLLLMILSICTSNTHTHTHTHPYVLRKEWEMCVCVSFVSPVYLLYNF